MGKRIFKLKTLLCVIAVLILSFAFALAGCAEYKPPENGGGSSGGNTPGTEEPENPNPPVTGEDGFTVQLIYSRGDFNQNVCKDVTKVQAQWTDLQSGQVYRAYFDKDGIATRADLDGDYKVTLVNLPSVGNTEYTYRPNNYRVNNDLKDVQIMLYPITPMSLSMQPYQGDIEGETRGTVNYYEVNSIGAYRIVLHSATERVYFTFRASEQGTYTVKTLVDVTRDEVNPILDMFWGAFPSFINPKPAATFDGGGPEYEEGDYTKNVYLQRSFTKQEIGGGLTFRMYSTCRNDPATAYGNGLVVDFIIDRDGSYENAFYESEEVPVTEDFARRPALPIGQYKQVTELDATGRNILDEDKVKFNPEDGYYWIIDESGNFKTRLYAKLTRGAMAGSMLIEFRDATDLNYIVPRPNGKAYFYTRFIEDYLDNCYEENGCYPVTQELQLFLQRFALHRRLFNDGNTGFGLGLAEEHGYNSDEDSQWLFACGFFE